MNDAVMRKRDIKETTLVQGTMGQSLNVRLLGSQFANRSWRIYKTFIIRRL